MFNHKGEYYRIVGVAEDVTERKEAERAMMKARDAAESSNRAKTEFLANISHELRTPLNPIIGMTDLLLDGEVNAEQEEFLNDIRISAVGLLGIINDLIELSRSRPRTWNFATYLSVCGSAWPELPGDCRSRPIKRG